MADCPGDLFLGDTTPSCDEQQMYASDHGPVVHRAPVSSAAPPVESRGGATSPPRRNRSRPFDARRALIPGYRTPPPFRGPSHNSGALRARPRTTVVGAT